VDTSFAPEDLAFRDEVRAFYAQAYDEELQGRLNSGEPVIYTFGTDEQKECFRMHTN